MEAIGSRPVRREGLFQLLSHKSVRSTLWIGLVVLILALGAIVLLFPVGFMITTSLKARGDVFLLPLKWLPGIQYPAHFDNFPAALDFMKWPIVFGNTLKISLLNMIGDTLSAAVVAYGFARFRAPGRDVLFTIVLATLMIPYQVRLVPEFLAYSLMHLINTLWPLIIPAWFGSAFNIFLLRQFFMTIPMEMDEAAEIDGAGPVRIFASVLLPQLTPALAAVAIGSFTYNWNDFLRPLIYLNDPNSQTAAVALAGFSSAYGGTPWNLLMAASLVMLIPVLALFFVAQRYFIQGIVISGVKG
jgi:ABC-type glycerol-3-phosphate transport system permease component